MRVKVEQQNVFSYFFFCFSVFFFFVEMSTIKHEKADPSRSFSQIQSDPTRLNKRAQAAAPFPVTLFCKNLFMKHIKSVNTACRT